MTSSSTPRAADRGRDPLRRGAVEVGHDDVVPRLGEPLGVGAPEAVGAARDERDPPLAHQTMRIGRATSRSSPNAVPASA